MTPPNLNYLIRIQLSPKILKGSELNIKAQQTFIQRSTHSTGTNLIRRENIARLKRGTKPKKISPKFNRVD